MLVKTHKAGRFFPLWVVLVFISILADNSHASSIPAFQAAGTAQSGTGAVSPAWPAHQIDDIALLFIESTGGGTATLSTPAGFLPVDNSPQSTGSGTAGTRLTVFWARATSAGMATPTVADAGNHVYAQILTYRGAIASGNPWDISGGGVKATASTSVTIAGVSTTAVNTLIVQACSKDTDTTAAGFSAQTNANLTGLTERVDAGTTSGNGGGFAVWDGGLATAGPTGDTTATVTSSVNAFLTIALKPKLDQTITFGAAPSVVVGGTGTVSATAASGLAVTFTSTTPAVCTILGSTVTGVSAGTCTIAADQAGNGTYNPAPQATQSFAVGKGNQTITFGAAPSLSVGSTALVSATASSGLPVSFSSTTPSVCSISGNLVTGLAMGSCTIAADQAGNANYHPAPQVLQSFMVGNQVCYTDNFNDLANWAVGSEGTTPFTPIATSNLLRLTDNVTSISTYATLNRLFPGFGNKIVVEFNLYAYGTVGSTAGADGIAVVLSDASVAPIAGAFGGSLGYAQKMVSAGGDTTHAGFSGGWLGVGLDEYGNFSANTEGRSSGSAPGRTIDAVAIRGSGSGFSGYAYIGGTAGGLGIDTGTTSPGPNHRYRITVDHSNSVNAYTTVERDTTGTGSSYSTLIPSFDAKAAIGQVAVPTHWLLSLTGATGASTNIHELASLSVCSNSQQVMVLDHVRLEHDGAGQSCGPEPITLKACADPACTTLYMNSVTVVLSKTDTGGPSTLSADTLTFTGGQAQVTLSKATAGSVTLAGTVTNPAISNTTAVCYNGTGELSCAAYPVVFTVSSACFNAAEVFNPPGSRIYTKLSATPFSLDIMAVSGNTVNTGFTGPVCVALVNPYAASGNCGDSAPGLTSEQLYTFVTADQGRRTFNFNYPNAAQNIRVRIRPIANCSNASAAVCSSDDFSIRPYALSVLNNPTSASADTGNGSAPSATPAFAAGSGSFTVGATAVLPSGAAAPYYTGLPKVNTALLQGSPILGTLATYPTPSSPPTFQTAASGGCTTCTPLGTFSYSEAGYVLFNLQSLYDDSWADHDLLNGDCYDDDANHFRNTLLNGKYGCLFGNTSDLSASNKFWAGRFIPHHFDTAVTPACSATFSYSGQPFSASLTAKNAAGNTAVNYSSASGFAKTVTLSDANGAPGGSLSPASVAAGAFAAGIANATPAYTFANAATPPRTVKLRATDSEGVSSAGSSEGSTAVRSGRLRLDNAYGSELLDLSVPIALEYYDAGSWQKNNADQCTLLTANHFSFAFPGAALSACETALAVGGSAPDYSLTLSAPGLGNNGQATLSPKLGSTAGGSQCSVVGGPGPAAVPANQPWLQYDWSGAGVGNPAAVAVFGIHKSNVIDLREIY